MRLINYTIRNLTVVLLVIIPLWAGLFYFKIIDEVNDETDDTLENLRSLIIKRALADTAIFNQTSDDVMTKYFITEISEAKAERYREHFIDSVMFVEEEMEFDPVRVLKTAFRGDDSKYYELTVMTSILEKDDLQEAIFYWSLGLYILLILTILIVSRVVFKKSLRPLYKLLDWLNGFTLGKSNAPLDSRTRVTEFMILNKTIEDMVKRNENIFIRQKQFIENASHELQTPLAICRNKLELLADSGNFTEDQFSTLDDIHKTMDRAIRLNKSLLLLSRIENRQFHDEKQITLNPFIKELTGDLSDIYESKNLKVTFDESAQLTVRMNESLAVTLLTNLLKNAYNHSESNSDIKITISKNKLIISNHCGTHSLDKEKIFDRFYHSLDKNESTGLGLAIVRSITSLYGIKIDYYFDGLHNFTLFFPNLS